MRIIKIGKRQFAFDLIWNNSYGDDAEEAVESANGEGVPSYFTVLTGEDDNSVLGYAVAGDTKGPIYSYAAALCKQKSDGVFAAEVSANEVWFVAIVKGVVLSASDRTMPRYEAEDSIRDILDEVDVPLFTVGGCLPGLDDFLRGRNREAIAFDIEKIVMKVKLKPLKKIGGTQNSIIGAVVLLAVVGAVGYGGWSMFFKKQELLVDPATVAAQAKAAYVQAATTELSQLSDDAEWVGDAYRAAILTFPPVISGWLLDGVTCTPGSCSAIYSVNKAGGGYSLSTVKALFNQAGQGAVQVMPDQKSISLVLNLASKPSEPYGEDEVYGAKPPVVSTVDVLGGLGLRFAEVSVDGEVKADQLNQTLSAPADAPTLVRETVATRFDAAIDLVKVRILSAYMAEAGFVATQISYSMGIGAVTPAWRIEWVRVHGGEK